MFAVYAIALLCWMSVSHSAPLDCKNLLRPSDQVDLPHLEGRWVLIAGSVSDPAHLEKFKSRDSAIITFANHSDASKVSFTRIFSFGDSCQYMKSNITLQGSGFTFEQFNVTVTVLQTSCQDCAVMRFDDQSKKPVRFYLFSRKRDVEQKDLEEFKAQTECLKMSEPSIMDPTKELCPEEISVDKNMMFLNKPSSDKHMAELS
uniref:Apolipoprotein M n=1 Tax=Amphiprion ocellaris TaxID=80972 RepID=A0A3Q1BFE4_AMPOC